MATMGTLEELPVSYRAGLTKRNLVPLWPSMRAALPHDIPNRRTKPVVWRYSQDVRPYLLRAGELTPIEKAERRVLVLSNPGLGLDSMQATPAIFIGMPMILPGETAPNHKHSPSAVRFVVEGEGGFTVVGGEKMPMERGDLILTPSGLWHQHGHEGNAPVIWLDALDLPMVLALEASYAVEGPPQTISNEPDSSQSRYIRSGLVPYGSLAKARGAYPLLRFPWKEVREALGSFASVTPRGDMVQLAYVNPETGEECLPVLGFSAIMLRPGETVAPPRRSTSAVLHVVEGSIEATIDDQDLKADTNDTVAIPTHARISVRNASAKSAAYMFQVDDAPLQRKLGFFEQFD